MPWLGVSDPETPTDYFTSPTGLASLAPDKGLAAWQQFQSNLETGLGGMLSRGLARDFIDPVRPWWMDRQTDQIRARDLNERYGIEGRLNFSHAMSERAASELYQVKQRQIWAEENMSRAGLGVASQIGLSLAAGFADPANIALSFTPIPWMARAHALEQGLSGAARIGTRVGLGAAEGAAGAVLFEPLVYSMNQAEGNDYTFTDSLMNVFVAAGAGAVFRPLFLGLTEGGKGVAPDVEDRALLDDGDGDLVDLSTVDKKALPSNFAARAKQIDNVPLADKLPPEAEKANVDTRLSAMAKAIEDVAEGRDVDVGQVFAEAASRGLNDLEDSGATRQLKFRPIKQSEAITPDNQSLPVTYALVELDDLIVSHRLDGMPNPDYPEALQPRDRGKMTSQLQVNEMAATLNPKRLGETFDAQTGAPIVGADGLVESGNGRVMALQQAMANDLPSAQAYRDWLEAQGYDLADMENPILVRVADAGRDAQARVDFAASANARQTAAYDPMEVAVQDAGRLSVDDLAKHQGGSVTKAENMDFARASLDKIASKEDLGELINAKTGKLSQKGEARLSAALVQIAFDDPQIVHDLFNRTDDVMRGIGTALAEIAPNWAKMRAAVKAGQIAAGVDATDNLVGALNIARRARQLNQSVAKTIETLDMFDELSPATRDMLEIMFGPELKRQISASRITAAFDKYLEQAMLADAGPSLFGDAPDVRAQDLTSLAVRAANESGEPAIERALPARAEGADGGGNGGNGQDGGNAGGSQPLPSEGGSPPERKPKGVARLLAGHDDPELARLQAETDNIDGMIDALEAGGALDAGELAALRALTPDQARMDLEADALRAAELCLTTTQGNLL